MILDEEEEDKFDRDEEFYGLNYDDDSLIDFFYEDEDSDDTLDRYPWVEDEEYDHMKDIDDYFMDEYYDDYGGDVYSDDY